jgi:hypothetical protein
VLCTQHQSTRNLQALFERRLALAVSPPSGDSRKVTPEVTKETRTRAEPSDSARLGHSCPQEP